MKPSHAALPMFLDPRHLALAGEVGKRVATADARLHDPQTVARAMAEMGLFELLVPPKLDVRSLCVVREALAYESPLADSVFAVQGLGSHPVVITSAFARRDEILREVTSGKRVGAFALTEPEAGSDVASMRTTARKDGDAWVLDGEKVFISNVGIANHFIVFANADPGAGKRGISAFFVELGSPGLSLETIALSVDHPLGRVVLEGCRVPKDALLGEVGHGMRLALGTLDVFRTSVGAAAVGMAQRALDESLARVTKRVQFNQPLSDFQLTQAALADMATELEAARLLVMRAAWQKDQSSTPTPESTMAVAMAKMFATEAAQRIIDRAVQLHGGMGVALGSVVERLYREIRPLRIYEGTTEIQKLILGSSLVKQAKESDES